MAQTNSLKNFPVALFSSVMGFSAFTIAIQQAEDMFFQKQLLSVILLIFSTLLFLLNGGILIYRLVKYFAVVQKDFNHPIQMNFFGTITISLSLLAVLYLQVSEKLSFVLWSFGALFQLLLTLRILKKLMWWDEVEINHLTPVTFIPIVGNLLVPLAGVTHASEWINWFYFSIGIFFSVIFLTLMFYRIIFHQRMHDQMLPTIFIFLAPPSVAFVSYVTIAEHINHFSIILYGVALFIVLWIAFQLKEILSVPFFVSWWSLLFPTAAFTVATLRVYEYTPIVFLLWLSIVLFICLTGMAVFLLWKTVKQFIRSS